MEVIPPSAASALQGRERTTAVPGSPRGSDPPPALSARENRGGDDRPRPPPYQGGAGMNARPSGPPPTGLTPSTVSERDRTTGTGPPVEGRSPPRRPRARPTIAGCRRAGPGHTPSRFRSAYPPCACPRRRPPPGPVCRRHRDRDGREVVAEATGSPASRACRLIPRTGPGLVLAADRRAQADTAVRDRPDLEP